MSAPDDGGGGMMAKLGDICTFQTGGTPNKKAPAYFQGDIPWITTVSLNGSILDGSAAMDWITDRAIAETAAKIVPAQSILVGTRVGIGKVSINAVPMSVSQDIVALLNIDEENWNKKYLCRWLEGKREYLLSQARGATIKGIKIDTIAGLPVPEISLEKQKSIAESMDRVNSLISLRKQQLAKLDELVKARFVEMFGDPLQNPKGLKIAALSEVAKYYCGLTYKPEDAQNTGVIVLRSSNIQNGELDLSDIVRVGCSIRDRLLVQENDILMCSRNGSANLVGKTALIKGLKEKMTFGAFMMIIRSPYYAYLTAYFQMDAFRRQIKTGATTTINQITGRMMDAIKLPVPEKEEMMEFNQYIERIVQLKQTARQALDKLELLKKSLIQEYFG